MASILLNVNGAQHTVDVSPDMPLLWVLRDLLGLTGTKYGCGEGLCGACTVQVDGVARRSCLLPVGRTVGRAITTIEGLAPNSDHPLQRAWLAENVAQCGYCQPGQLMAAAALLAAHAHPTDEQIDEALANNLCRCGTYLRIRRAIKRAAEEGGAA